MLAGWVIGFALGLLGGGGGAPLVQKRSYLYGLPELPSLPAVSSAVSSRRMKDQSRSPCEH